MEFYCLKALSLMAWFSAFIPLLQLPICFCRLSYAASSLTQHLGAFLDTARRQIWHRDGSHHLWVRGHQPSPPASLVPERDWSLPHTPGRGGGRLLHAVLLLCSYWRGLCPALLLLPAADGFLGARGSHQHLPHQLDVLDQHLPIRHLQIH